MARCFLFLLTAPIVVGCSSNVPAGNSTSAFDRGFVNSFRPKFVESCRAGAQRTSGATTDFTAICGCIADKLIATKSVHELMANPSQEEIKSHAEACARETMPR